MPARRRKQSNAMLYTLITFVGLFIIATTIAVIYYVEAEDKRTRLADLQNRIDELATNREQDTLGTLVGTRLSRQTWLGTMVGHLNNTTSLIVGGVPESTSAEVKINDVNSAVVKAVQAAQEHIDIMDPNKIGLVPIIGELTAELNNTKNAKLAIQKDLNDQIEKFEIAQKAYEEREQAIQAEKDKLQELVNTIQSDYEMLQETLRTNNQERVETLSTQLNQARNNLNELNYELLETQAILKMTEDNLKSTKQQISEIKPPPDHEALAYQADGKIILVDNNAKMVHLNIGSNQHVYKGLTFTVYDRNAPIPKDGQGKAEIEVYDVAETYSAARITRSESKNPILEGDIAANLIWNSDETNVFVVAGDFDLDNNGNIDFNAIEKITLLIEKWGGKVTDAISIDTDFLLLGSQPMVPEQQPSLEEQDEDPEAMQRYTDMLRKLEHYNQLQGKAQALWIPIFTYERFLYFIGYKGQVSQAGAF